MGTSCNVEDETLALLLEFDVNHGDFSAPVLKDVDDAVKIRSGNSIKQRHGVETDSRNVQGTS